MRAIKVTYRAIFQQPIGTLNPMGLKLPGPFPVEVYGSGDHWKIREIASLKQQQYVKLGEHPGPTAAKHVAEQSFALKLERWQTWGTPPDTSDARLLLPHEFRLLTLEGKERAYWLEPEDFTHIIHAPTLDPKEKVPSAACGAKVKADAFINNKANVEPTCKACAAVWQEHYQGKSA